MNLTDDKIKASISLNASLLGATDEQKSYIAQLEARIRLLEQSQRELEANRADDAVLTQFAELLRWDVSEEPELWGDRLVAALARTFNAQCAVLYRLDNTAEPPCLRRMGGYALPADTPEAIELGHGLTGQVALDQNAIYLPEGQAFRQVNSGQNTLQLKALLVTPLLHNNLLQGVLELAASADFSAHHRELMTKLQNLLAASLSTLNSQLHIRHFYENTDRHAVELAQREAAFQRKTEEFLHLKATHEDTLYKARAMEGAVDTMLCRVEMLPNGEFYAANDAFCKTLGYEWYELRNRHHSILVPKELAGSEAYKKFWDDLAKGIMMEGEFERINKHGEVVVMRAVYRPVMNDEGKLLRVFKLALDITGERKQAEALAEQRYETEQLREKLVQALKH